MDDDDDFDDNNNDDGFGPLPLLPSPPPFGLLLCNPPLPSISENDNEIGKDLTPAQNFYLVTLLKCHH